MGFVIISIIATCAIIGFVLHYRFIQTLMNKYPQIWEELGSPTFFINNTIRNNFSVLSFLNKKKYLELSDSDFTKQCNILRMFGRGYLVLFLILMPIFVLFIIRST